MPIKYFTLRQQYITYRHIIIGIFLAFYSQFTFAAANFNITPASEYYWPTFIYPGQTVHAYYKITNMTNGTRHNYSLKGLPAGVSQNQGDNQFCQSSITLAPLASCILKLDINAPVHASFGLCLANNCSAPATPLAITQVNSAQPQYAYIADQNAQSVFKCSVNSDGSFNQCNPTPSSQVSNWQPSTITFTNVNNTKYAYVTDPNDNLLTKCLVNPDGELTHCAPLNITGNAVSLTFATFEEKQFAYIANISLDSGVDQCGLSIDGSPNVCQKTPTIGAPSWFPFSTTIATITDTKYAYVSTAALGPSLLYKCNLNANGTYQDNGCTSTPTPSEVWRPASVNFATFNNTQFAYVADRGGNVYQCTVASNGELGVCNITPTSGAPTWTPYNILFLTFNSTRYAYVSGGFAGVFQCTLNENGSFNTCSTILPTTAPWTNPTWIAFE